MSIINLAERNELDRAISDQGRVVTGYAIDPLKCRDPDDAIDIIEGRYIRVSIACPALGVEPASSLFNQAVYHGDTRYGASPKRSSYMLPDSVLRGYALGSSLRRCIQRQSPIPSLNLVLDIDESGLPQAREIF